MVAFDGIPLGKVSSSMTINSTASTLLAYYIAVGEAQGFKSHELRGTTQNDISKRVHCKKHLHLSTPTINATNW